MQQHLWMTTYEIRNKYNDILGETRKDEYVATKGNNVMLLQRHLENVNGDKVIVLLDAQYCGTVQVEKV